MFNLISKISDINYNLEIFYRYIFFDFFLLGKKKIMMGLDIYLIENIIFSIYIITYCIQIWVNLILHRVSEKYH